MTYIPRGPDDRPSDRELALDHLEPAVIPPHTCTSPDPARCLQCALDAVVAEQKEERRVWDEYKASQRDEEAS